MSDLAKEIRGLAHSSRVVRAARVYMMRKKRTEISQTASITNSVVPGLMALGSRSSIQNSHISGNVFLGKDCYIANCSLAGNVQIGDFTTINSDSQLIARISSIRLGKFCSVGPDCYFQSYNHATDQITTYFIHKKLASLSQPWQLRNHSSNYVDAQSKGPILIENDVWIGTKTIILSGVSIGNGAVIGAGSVVTKDVPAYSVVAGAPARIVSYRFNQETISRLLALHWWDWPIDVLRDSLDCFSGPLNSGKLERLEQKREEIS